MDDFVLNRFNISGLRGLVGEEINPFSLIPALEGYIEFMNPENLALGKDTRNSSEPIANFIKGYLALKGINIVDLGILPTPSLLFNVKYLNLDGGIMITASHNPISYNALKFVKKGGYFLNRDDVKKIFEILKNQPNIFVKNEFKDFKNLGKIVKEESGVLNHIDKIKKVLNLEMIKTKKFNVALDLCNGTAIYAIPQLFENLGVNFNSIFDNPEKAFERVAEPNFNTLKPLSKFMKGKKFDIGFAFDPDADRVVTILKGGKLISEEFTLAFAYYYYVKYLDGRDAVVNLSTSSIINKIAEEFSKNIHYAPVGEINVTEKMKSLNLEFGGEGNGGIIYFPISNSRDTLTGVSLILSLLAKEDDSLENIYEKYKNVKMLKDKLDLNTIFKSNFVFNDEFKNKYYEKLEILLKQNFDNIKNISNIDGVRIDFDFGFLHVRFSNTEPILRIIIESNNEIEINKINYKIKELIKEIKI